MRKVILPGNSPEGVIHASVGDQILDQFNRVWTKKGTSGNTGWALELRFFPEDSAVLSGNNDVFEKGDLIYELDTGTVKYGDGATPYNSLASSGGGPAGPAGADGDAGAIGPMGPAGPKGEKGDTGSVGLTGAKGDTGPQGPQGVTGATGAAGSAGAQGPVGDQGPQGTQGPQGVQGAQGPQGIQGPQGPAAAWGSIGGNLADQADLQAVIDNFNTLLSSDEVSLDTLQEIVDFIQLNREDLDALGINSIAGLQAALDGKSNTGHTHTEADVTDLDKYTQAQVDAFAKGTTKVLDLNTTKAEFNASESKVWITYLFYKEILTAGVALDHPQTVLNLTDVTTTLDIAGGGSVTIEPYTSKRIQYTGAALITTTTRIEIGYVNGLQAALDGKEPTVTSTKNVLNLPGITNLSGVTAQDLGGVATADLLESTVVVLVNLPTTVTVDADLVVTTPTWALNFSGRPGSESSAAIFAADSATLWWSPVEF